MTRTGTDGTRVASMAQVIVVQKTSYWFTPRARWRDCGSPTCRLLRTDSKRFHFLHFVYGLEIAAYARAAFAHLFALALLVVICGARIRRVCASEQPRSRCRPTYWDLTKTSSSSRATPSSGASSRAESIPVIHEHPLAEYRQVPKQAAISGRAPVLRPKAAKKPLAPVPVPVPLGPARIPLTGR